VIFPIYRRRSVLYSLFVCLAANLFLVPIGQAFQENEASSQRQGQLVVDVVAISASTPAEVKEVETRIAATFDEAASQNPDGTLKIANLGEPSADGVSDAIIRQSHAPIQNVTPSRVRQYFRNPDKVENLVGAILRGTVNGYVTCAAFVYSQHVSWASLIPAGLSIALLSGGIQERLDDFHVWVKSGRLAQFLYPKLRKKPVDEYELVKWNANLKKWKEREFYGRWYLTQFIFMGVIDLALINTGVWKGQSLPGIILITMYTSLFLLYSEGAPENAIIEGTKMAGERAISELELQRPVSETEKRQIGRRYLRLKRLLTGINAVACTSLGATRNTTEVFLPSDKPGVALLAMGALGLGVTAKLACMRARQTCAQKLAPDS
jgi:hypothetical protein